MTVSPSWLGNLLAAVMLLIAGYCAVRIVAVYATRRRTHLDVELAHIAMGVGMAGMLDPSVQSLPTGVWQVVFAAMTGWFAFELVRLLRASRPVRRSADVARSDRVHHASHSISHLAMAGGMLYMFCELPAATLGTALHQRATTVMVMGAGAPTSGLNGSGLPALLAVFLVIGAVWYADGLTRFQRSGVVAAGGPTRIVSISVPISCHDNLWMAPRVQITAHVVMCVVMSYMLVLMA